ncbi:exosome non-catalytic core subunit rrp46 [Dispira simplex]|nr:exosome non-catalytic core subunit rrp46 [Dispira simplex]
MSDIKRPDQRSSQQIRPLEIHQGLLHRSDGSAQFEFGPTKVLCGVYGPLEVNHKDAHVDRATLRVNVKPLRGLSTTLDRCLEHALRHVGEAIVVTTWHPSTLIEINVQEVASHGGTLAASCNAAVLTLVDAGVPLRCMAASVGCMIDGQGQVLLDPTEEEMIQAKSVHTFVFGSEEEGPLFTDSVGTFTVDQFNVCHELCRMGASKVLSFMKVAIENRVQKYTQQEAI